MKKPHLRKPFYTLLLLWFCTTAVSLAQAPAADLDSITEDSYRRMLERQAAEQTSDSLIRSHAQPVVQEQKSKEWTWWNYLLFVFAVFLVLLVFRYYRQIFRIGTKI